MLGVDGWEKGEAILALKTMVGSLNVSLAVADCSLNAGGVIGVHCVALSANLALDDFTLGEWHNVGHAISNVLLNTGIGCVDLIASSALLAGSSVGEDAVGEAGLGCCALDVTGWKCCRCC